MSKSIASRNEKDSPVWSLEKSGNFSVKSMYDHLCEAHNCPNGFIFKAKIPLKIKIFMWLIKQGVILTEDNLIRKNWK